MLLRHARILAVAVLAAAGSLWIAPPAHAGPAATDRVLDLVTCNGQGDVEYSPGLTLAPKNVTYAMGLTFSLCPTGDGLQSASFAQFGFNPGATCLTNIGGGIGEISHVAASVIGVVQLYTATATATVRSGRYLGHSMNITALLAADLDNPLPCLTLKGVTALSGIATLIVL